VLGRMLGAGARAVGRQVRLVAALYGVQLTFGLLFTFLVAQTLTTLFGNRPAFDRALDGGLPKILILFDRHDGTLFALVWAGVALALGYLVFSWYLGAGLLGALAGRPFGETAARRFFGFARVAALSLVPYTVASILLGVGWADLEVATSLGATITHAALRALPALIVLIVTWCAIDYARAELVLADKPRALRAFLRGYKRVFTRGWAIVHYLCYLVAWVAVTLAYLAVTYDRPFHGAGGALVLFGFRQLTAVARFVLRTGVSGGQVAALEADAAQDRADRRPRVEELRPRADEGGDPVGSDPTPDRADA